MSEYTQFDLFGRPAGVRSAPAAQQYQTLRERVPSRIRLGTSSWSFPGWAGIVYDAQHTEQVLARHGLAAYARHPLLRSVSIDRTYYAPIDAATFADYASAVPDDFRFLVKADRALTDPEAQSTTGDRFLDAEHAALSVVHPALTGLGEKLGGIVFQFSPRTAARHGGRDRFAMQLREFLEALPVGPVYSVELRNPALLTPAYAEGLAAAGAAHCYTVHPSMLPLRAQFERIPARANPMLVVRWMLREGLSYEGARSAYAPFDRIVAEDVVTRNEIARASLECAHDDRDVIICINNKAEGSAPLSAIRLAEAIVAER